MTTAHIGAGREAAGTQPPLDLASLIQPIPAADFLADYWEQQPLIVHRADPGYYSGLLTLYDMDRILSTSGLRTSEEVRLVSDGKEIPLGQVISGQAGGQLAALEGVYEAYRKGATVNLVFLHERHEPLAALCRSLAAQLSCGCPRTTTPTTYSSSRHMARNTGGCTTHRSPSRLMARR
jgi:Cupin superfamily protein